MVFRTRRGPQEGGRFCTLRSAAIGFALLLLAILTINLANPPWRTVASNRQAQGYSVSELIDSQLVNVTNIFGRPTNTQGSTKVQESVEVEKIEELEEDTPQEGGEKKIIGSQVDMIEALIQAKQRIAEERANKAQAELNEKMRKEEEERRKREEHEELRKKQEEERKANEEAERKRKEEEERRAREEEERKAKEEAAQSQVAPVKPSGGEEAGKGDELALWRRWEAGHVDPLVPAVVNVREAFPAEGRPQLHRTKEETKVQKILYLISSTDRGQRIQSQWKGDKLQTLLVILRSFPKVMCERGFDVTVWFVSAWKISEHEQAINEALQCQRTEKPVQTKYWDHFPRDIEGNLAHKHRLAVKEMIDSYDFFISGEDDIHITPIMVDAFFAASNRLALAPPDQRDNHFLGFSRKEHDKKRDDAWSVWETDKHDYTAKYIPQAGYFASVGNNTHQAMWMGTREQLYHFDRRCPDGFFNIKPGPWVEFWSGALQLWDHCQGLRKVLPVGTFRNFTVWHMTDTKLYHRGKGVDPVDNIVAKLEAQRREQEKARTGRVEF